MPDEEQLAILRCGAKDWNQWREDNPKLKIDLRRAQFSGAHLSGVNLSGVNLSGADLSGADLSGADLSGAKLSKVHLRQAYLYGTNLRRTHLSEAFLFKADLSKTNLYGAYLYGAYLYGANLYGANLSKADLSEADLSEADLSEADLSEADLSGVSLSEADLSGVNLSGVNLSGVNLSGVNLSGVNLSGAKLCHTLCKLSTLVGASLKSADLTGACIQDWNINSETDFEGVICNYIFLRWDENNQKGIERRPSTPTCNFTLGDFERFICQSLDTVDLIFGEGIDWNAFLRSFQGLQLDSEVGELDIAGIKKNRDGSFVVQVDVPADADKAAIEKNFWSRYQPLLEAKDQQIKLLQGQLEYSQEQIDRERQNATKLTNIIETLAEKQGNIINQYGNFGIGANNGEVSNDAVVAGQYNEAEKQTLQQAVVEIKALLKQLETEYGSDTMSEKMTVATEVIKEIEQNQNLAQRIIAALKAGGISALDSYLDTPAASFVISAIQSWYEADQQSQ
ncbi:pentapeptide repeat protein [[Leptolyngbya] sp. PCC 7376]|uniref:pentapeptide repeat-containing protein n=1 Tax=[Leptolyngbya] sp. PCC 7376 TaxID=111781 RepID=UPI00029ED8C0|nr:pentapeptide repeat-containing protein [[Leptolyngbya] sp. PCC 7376]AFY37592.1 pentapeptide repeat protein [[Leptolyngbya] sp. PCC 7376]